MGRFFVQPGLSLAWLMSTILSASPVQGQAPLVFPKPERLQRDHAGNLTVFDGLFRIGSPTGGRLVSVESDAYGGASLEAGVRVEFVFPSEKPQGFCSVSIHPVAQVTPTRAQLETAAEFGEAVPRLDSVSQAGGVDRYIQEAAWAFERIYARPGVGTSRSETSNPSPGWARADITYLGDDDEDVGYNGRAAILVARFGDRHFRVDRKCDSYEGDDFLTRIWGSFSVTPVADARAAAPTLAPPPPPIPTPVMMPPMALPQPAPRGAGCRTVQTYDAAGRLLADRVVCPRAAEAEPKSGS